MKVLFTFLAISMLSLSLYSEQHSPQIYYDEFFTIVEGDHRDSVLPFARLGDAFTVQIINIGNGWFLPYTLLNMPAVGGICSGSVYKSANLVGSNLPVTTGTTYTFYFVKASIDAWADSGDNTCLQIELSSIPVQFMVSGGSVLGDAGGEWELSGSAGSWTGASRLSSWDGAFVVTGDGSNDG